jgi:hypothetical protein
MGRREGDGDGKMGRREGDGITKKRRKVPVRRMRCPMQGPGQKGLAQIRSEYEEMEKEKEEGKEKRKATGLKKRSFWASSPILALSLLAQPFFIPNRFALSLLSNPDQLG